MVTLIDIPLFLSVTISSNFLFERLTKGRICLKGTLLTIFGPSISMFESFWNYQKTQRLTVIRFQNCLHISDYLFIFFHPV